MKTKDKTTLAPEISEQEESQTEVIEQPHFSSFNFPVSSYEKLFEEKDAVLWLGKNERMKVPANSTLFLFQMLGNATIHRRDYFPKTQIIGENSYACVNSGEIEFNGKTLVIEVKNFKGMNMTGGPTEKSGRLKYIDGCTDSLLIPPVKYGDACLNALYFPAGTRQTQHTHPSVRIGAVISGRGLCLIPGREIPLEQGMVFVIHTDKEHSFQTDDEQMTVIAFHPDSDFGAKDEEHPMINRTIVDGTSAKHLQDIRTK